MSKLLHRWRKEAEEAGHRITRITVGFEAGFDIRFAESAITAPPCGGRMPITCAPHLCEMPEQSGPVLRETFAPILYLMRYSELDEAIRLHNAVGAGRCAPLLFHLHSRHARRKDLCRLQRRDFITLVSGAAVAWPIAARAQGAGDLPRVAILSPYPATTDRLAPFLGALRELGYVDLKLFNRWREEAEQAGHRIKRIAVVFEAGRDGFWLARWLGARDIEALEGAWAGFLRAWRVFAAAIWRRPPVRVTAIMDLSASSDRAPRARSSAYAS